MKNVLLLELLYSIEEKKWDALKSFIIGQRLEQEVIDFFNELISNPKELKSTHKILVEKNKRSRYIKEKLVDAVENFLLLKQLQARPTQRNLFLLEYFQDKSLSKNYNSTSKNLEKSLQQTPIDSYHFYYQFRKHELLARKAKDIHKQMTALTDMTKSLKCFYVENYKRITCETAAQKEIINAKYPIEEIDDFNSTNKNVLVSIYEKIYQLHTEANTNLCYAELEKILQLKVSGLSSDVLHTIHAHLLNHCTKQLNSGSVQWAKKYIFLIDSLIKNKWLLENKVLNMSRYMNMVTACLLSSEYERAITFNNKYSSYTPISKKENIQGLNKIRIHTHKQEYEKAINELGTFTRTYKSLSLFSKILYRKLELKIIFVDEKRWNSLESTLKNFRALIGGKDKTTLSGGAKLEALRNFASCFDKLVKGKLTLAIIKSTPLSATDRLWLEKNI